VRELNREKGEMEACRSSKSDVVGFGEGKKKILSAPAFSLYNRLIDYRLLQTR
jgi:hypothetical protein